MSKKATPKSKRTKRLRASYAVADELGVKVIEDRMLEPWGLQGQWEGGRTITINPRIASNYTVLHEIGHVLCGYGCCREHDEFKAYGVAIGLAKAYGIRLTRKALGSVDLYDGTSTRMACGIRSTRRGSRGATSRDQKERLCATLKDHSQGHGGQGSPAARERAAARLLSFSRSPAGS